MLIIRLQRVGRKNDPSFRVVVVDSKKAAKSGKALEVLGSHDPRHDRTELKAERIKHWLSVGAQVSQTVNNLLVKKEIISGPSIDVSSKKLGKKATAAQAALKSAKEKAEKAEEAKKEALAQAESTPAEEAPAPSEEMPA